MYKTEVKLESKIFSQLRQALSPVTYRSAKYYHQQTLSGIDRSKPAGRVEQYKGRSADGRGFKRRFQRSAAGQYFANETGTLRNAITSGRTGEFSARVFIKNAINPRNGADAQVYGERLETKLNRIVMSKELARLTQIYQDYTVEKIVKDLL